MNKPLNPQEAAVQATEARRDAQRDTVLACRAVERLLAEDLAGTPLRGLTNLGSSREPLYAARVRSENPDERLIRGPYGPEAASRVLCLSAHGQLVQVAWTRIGGLRVEPAQDADLRAEDAEHMQRCLAQILPRHVARAGAAAKRYRRLAHVAQQILSLLVAETEE